MRAFRHLYPHGSGGETDSARKISLRKLEYFKNRLGSDDTRFASDLSYVFYALNACQRDQMRNRISWKLSQVGRRREQTKLGDLAARLYPSVGTVLRGSGEYYAKARRDLLKMTRSHGSPHVFLTCNLSYAPEFLCYVNPTRFGSIDCPVWNEIDAVDLAEMVKLVNDNCGMAAKMFDHRIRAFMSFLKSRDNGLFPGGQYVTELFGKVEMQRSGIGHVHFLLWLNREAFDSESLKGRAEIVDFVDSFLTTSLPDGNDDSVDIKLVRKYQVHIHTFTCRKGMFVRKKTASTAKKRSSEEVEHDSDDSDGDGADDVNELADETTRALADAQAENRKQAERARCRFGYPHMQSERTRFRTAPEMRSMVRGDRELIIKRLTEEAERTVAHVKVKT